MMLITTDTYMLTFGAAPAATDSPCRRENRFGSHYALARRCAR
jgi:hypothetical protein